MWRRPQVLYAITLEDYNRPGDNSAIECYCGTRFGIDTLVQKLNSVPNAGVRYAQTIAGQNSPVLTPVYVIRELDFVLADQNWNYYTPNGAVYSCYANRIHVSRVLAKVGYNYGIFIKAKLSNLAIWYEGSRWVSPCINGIPGMVTWDRGWYCVNLYILEDLYSLNDFQSASSEFVDASTIDLKFFMVNILA